MHGSRIPIWFFIGVLLMVYGIMIFAAGIFEWATASYPAGVELNRLHAPTWWGGLLMLLGIFYTLKFRPARTSSRKGLKG
jgi:hypothetical protein